MAEVHPLHESLLREFVALNGKVIPSLDWLKECMERRRQMPYSLASEFHSKLGVPVTSWDLEPSADGLVTFSDASNRGGRPVAEPQHAFPTWLRTSRFKTYTGFSEYVEKHKLLETGLDYQRCSYFVKGIRYTPVELVRLVQKESAGEVRLEHWYAVRDANADTYWHWGKQVTRAEAKRLVELAKDEKADPRPTP